MGSEHGHRSHADEQGEDQAVQGTLYPCKVGEKGDGGLQGEETAAPPFPNTEATRVVGRGSHGSLATPKRVAFLLQGGLHTGEFYLAFKELNMAPRERWPRKGYDILFKNYYCMRACMCPCSRAHVERSEDFVRPVIFFHRGTEGLTQATRRAQQVHLSTEPPHWPE